MEVWTGRKPLFEGRVLRKGRPGHATVQFLLRGSDKDGHPSWMEVVGELELHLDDGTDPYPLRGIFNGDKKLSPLAAPGISLPVKAHPEKNDRVVIDWKL